MSLLIASPFLAIKTWAYSAWLSEEQLNGPTRRVKTRRPRSLDRTCTAALREWLPAHPSRT